MTEPQCRRMYVRGRTKDKLPQAYRDAVSRTKVFLRNIFKI